MKKGAKKKLLKKKKEDIPGTSSIEILSGDEELIHNEDLTKKLLEVFNAHPNFIGQIDAVTEERMTYQEMRRSSVKLAMWLQTLYCGFCTNVVITVCTSNQMFATIPFLSSLYLDAIFNPWDVKYFDNHMRLMFFLVEYEPEVMFIDSKNYDTLIQCINTVNRNNREENIVSPRIVTFGQREEVESFEAIVNRNIDDEELSKFAHERIHPMNIAATMFTPNGANYPGKIYMRVFALTYPSNQEVPTMPTGSVGLWHGSFAWTFNVVLMLRSIINRVTVVKFSGSTDENLFGAIEKFKVNWVCLEGIKCTDMFKTDFHTHDLSSVKQVVLSDPLYKQSTYELLLENFKNTSIIQVYSISSEGIIAAYQQVTVDWLTNQSRGPLASNIQIKILDMQTKNPVNLHVKLNAEPPQGEIFFKYMFKWCKPKTCDMRHCWNYQAEKDNLDKKAKSAIATSWSSTEDYGYVNSNQELQVEGRKKTLIKYKGAHIAAERIERVLHYHPGVAEAVVCAMPNKDDGQHPIAYIRKETGIEVTKEEIIELMSNHLPDKYQLRGGVHFKMDFPYLPNGRIDRALVINTERLTIFVIDEHTL
ncbi:hypothetical protein PUN28_012231 [Cardiocondyla obscurior]|uniref:Uncharacterized protein n=1 Tax=Cardiocondyla obscurior TaxID=286306 RepID=A0AAW2FD17_9HYME